MSLRGRDMKDGSKHIMCEEHGTATTTYVCSHLVDDPLQRWHSNRASLDNPWPDAWCDRCNVKFARDGEWNESNSDGIEIQILCNYCYEGALGKSVSRLKGVQLENWRSFLDCCSEELRIKQETLKREYGLTRHKRWDWDQERGELVFSNDGIPAVTAAIQFVGSVSTKSGTWLWSWANPTTAEPVRSRIVAVHEFGEDRDFPHLVVPKWPAEEVDGWEMASVAAHVLGASGVYRTPGDSGFTFLLLSDVRAAQ
jgi:hypothetical protein